MLLKTQLVNAEQKKGKKIGVLTLSYKKQSNPYGDQNFRREGTSKAKSFTFVAAMVDSKNNKDQPETIEEV